MSQCLNFHWLTICPSVCLCSCWSPLQGNFCMKLWASLIFQKINIWRDANKHLIIPLGRKMSECEKRLLSSSPESKDRPAAQRATGRGSRGESKPSRVPIRVPIRVSLRVLTATIRRCWGHLPPPPCITLSGPPRPPGAPESHGPNIIKVIYCHGRFHSSGPPPRVKQPADL